MTTRDINRSVTELTGGSQHIADSVARVAQIAAATTKDAEATRQTAGELASTAASLDDITRSFRY